MIDEGWERVADPGRRAFVVCVSGGTMMRLLRLAIVGFVLLLSACAGLGGVPIEKAQGIRRIGIISAVGDKFDVRKIGFTVFGNDLATVPVAWGIDDLIISRARAILSKRFEVRPVSYQRAAFANSRGWGQSLADTVRSSASSEGVDAYVVIMGNVSQYGSSNQYLAGLGVVTAGVIGSESIVHALYSVTVIDAHDFNQLGFAAASPLDHSMGAALGFGGCGIHGPCRKIDASLTPVSGNPAEVGKLRGVVVELIEQSLPDTLARVQLAN
jgi:hypothetical protein